MRFTTSLIATLSVAGLAAALPQEPGSEKYECHAKCGGIITASRQPDFTCSAAIRADYSYCLGCAGPDKQNIWSMYGNSVSAAGQKCGWPTEPGVDFPAEEPTTTTTTAEPETSTTTPPTVETTTTTSSEATTTTTSAPAETTTAPAEEEEEEEEETPTTTAAPTTTSAPVVTTAPVVNNGTAGGNSTNGGAVPTPEFDGAAPTKFVSAGVIAAGFAAVAFLL